MANPVAVTAPHLKHDFGGLVLDNVAGIQDANGLPIGGAAQQATIADLAVTDGDVRFGGVKTITTNVDASGQGTAQTTPIVTVPAFAIILSVAAHVVVAFDGDTTTTFEVGITANPDQFIDTADFEPETLNLIVDNVLSTTADVNGISVSPTAGTAIEALWTNDGSGVAGSVDVTVVWVEMLDLGQAVETAASFAEVEAKVNAILVALEDAGIVADA